MTENQLAGIIILVSSIAIYLLATFIQKTKRFTWFSGWNPERMTDPDAYGILLCKSLKMFSIILGLGSLPMIFIQYLSDTQFLIITIATMTLSFIALVYYMLKAKKLYGK